MEAARLLAQQLIDKRLAACVQIQDGVRSVYRWDGKICDDTEVLLSAKTMSSDWERIETFIKAHHPYQLPEIVAIKPNECSKPYSDWVSQEVTG